MRVVKLFVSVILAFCMFTSSRFPKCTMYRIYKKSWLLSELFGYSLMSIHLLNLCIVGIVARYQSDNCVTISLISIRQQCLYLLWSLSPLSLTDVMLWQEELNLGFVYTCSLVTLSSLVNGHSGYQWSILNSYNIFLSVQSGLWLWHTQNWCLNPNPCLCSTSMPHLNFHVTDGQWSVYAWLSDSRF